MPRKFALHIQLVAFNMKVDVTAQPDLSPAAVGIDMYDSQSSFT